MRQLALVQTFFSRILVLLLSFALVIYSTNTWGSDGRGTISIIIANAAIVGFFSNIFAGSSISYFSSKYKVENVLLYAYIWSVAIGICVPLIFNFIYPQDDFLGYFIAISILFSLLSANINLFIGRQNIKLYNIYSVLQQLMHIVFLIFLVLVLKLSSVNTYFMAQIGCYGTLFLVSCFHIVKKFKLKNIDFSKDLMLVMFNYGWKSQLSAFIQFLNYRLSFYFLEYYEGIAWVGIFSIGVTFSEAIWTISRSIALVLYSEVVNSVDLENAVSKTKKSLKITFWITFLFVFILILIPNQLYVLIFGKEFSNTREIVLLLSPGILAIAVSNIVGYYFSGINQLGILNVKSLAGLLCTVLFSLITIPKWGIFGACLATTLSYSVSSGILFWKFYRTTDFRVRDYFFTKQEMKIYLRKIRFK